MAKFVERPYNTQLPINTFHGLLRGLATTRIKTLIVDGVRYPVSSVGFGMDETGNYFLINGMRISTQRQQVVSEDGETVMLVSPRIQKRVAQLYAHFKAKGHGKQELSLKGLTHAP